MRARAFYFMETMQQYYKLAAENLDYNPKTGIFTWNKDRTGGVKKGDIAGTISHRDGYVMIGCKMKRISAHRIAWFMFYGSIPDDKEIDHINNDRKDNRIVNLRLCTHAENQRNRRLASNNTSGYKGVVWNIKERKWVAQIKVGGKGMRLGSYHTPEEAHQKYKECAPIYHKEFARA